MTIINLKEKIYGDLSYLRISKIFFSSYIAASVKYFLEENLKSVFGKIDYESNELDYQTLNNCKSNRIVLTFLCAKNGRVVPEKYMFFRSSSIGSDSLEVAEELCFAKIPNDEGKEYFYTFPTSCWFKISIRNNEVISEKENIKEQICFDKENITFKRSVIGGSNLTLQPINACINGKIFFSLEDETTEPSKSFLKKIANNLTTNNIRTFDIKNGNIDSIYYLPEVFDLLRQEEKNRMAKLKRQNFQNKQ